MIRSHNRFGFGKYRGMLASDVAEIDPHYIWYVENNMNYVFTPAVKRIARAAADDLQTQQRRNARRSVPHGSLTNGFY